MLLKTPKHYGGMKYEKIKAYRFTASSCNVSGNVHRLRQGRRKRIGRS